jgi:6-phosphogluconate dehydrogenase
MQLGLIGLGRMGLNMGKRLTRAGHQVVGFNQEPAATQELAAAGGTAASSLADLVAKLAAPRHVWLMIPAGAVDAAIAELAPLLSPGDTIIDGGNSYYRDDLRRSKELAARGIQYMDCGVSGGVWGLERGYCVMIGGPTDAVRRLDPVFRALAPGVGTIPATPGRGGEGDTSTLGYLHCGPVGAGHFVKMVHNGIEYALMAAYAEGFNILRHANMGSEQVSTDAETTPLREPDAYRYDFDVARIAELWRRGSVVSSWLLDLTSVALAEDPALARFGGRVSDSGEGRWTVLAAVEEGVPAHVISAALFDRFESRGNADFANKMLSAMRHAFGGHHEKAAGSRH